MTTFAATMPMLALRATDAYLGRSGAYASPPPAFGPIEVRVLGRRAASRRPATTYAPPVPLRLVENGSGILVSFNRVSGADGTLYGPYFAAGSYDLLITAAYYRPQRVDAVPFAADGAAPSAPLQVPLEPGYRYPFPGGRQRNGLRGPTLVRGSISVAAGSAAGYLVAPVPANDVAPYLTSANGQWVLVFPEDARDGNTTIRITGPDGRKQTFSRVPVVAGQTTTAPVYSPTGQAP